MSALTPSQAAAIASGVYLLLDHTVAELRERQEPIGCEGLFTAGEDSKFAGKSGALMFKKISGFGYVAAGEGARAGELLVATRGTKITIDWLSNLNVAMQLGPGSRPVHAGFNEVWKSIAPEIRTMLRGRNPTRIHCVGHSLGGALAALNADFFSAGAVAEVLLYTFGSPRAGDGLFAHALTKRVTPQKIFRVSHPADPVPMIPLFPFWHLPFGQDGMTIAKTSNALISVGAHSMKNSYGAGVAEHSWTTLGHGGGPTADEGQRVKSWLQNAAEGKGSVAMGSATLLTMIGRALKWLIAKAGKLVMGSIGVAITASATVLDQMAWLLSQAASLSKEIGGHIKGLIGSIFNFLGRKLVGTVDVTAAFLRWVLALLFQSLRSVAQRALSLVS
jgi:hypothetical protein